MSKPTPGPWSVWNGAVYVEAEMGEPYSWTHEDGTTQQHRSGLLAIVYERFGEGQQTDGANARLIAAAPELLEALRAAEAKLFALAREFEGPRFTDRYGDGPEMRKIADQARAAIAKATGGGAAAKEVERPEHHETRGATESSVNG